MQRLLVGAVPAMLMVCLSSISAPSAGATGSCSHSEASHGSRWFDSRSGLTAFHRDSRHDSCNREHNGHHHDGDDHHGHPTATGSCVGSSDSPGGSPWFDPKAHVTTIKGSPDNDLIVGTNGPDLIYGLGGEDRISGGSGDDHVVGGPGGDIIEGGGGSDNLWGGPADDLIRGGNGRDHVVGEDGKDLLEGENGCDNILGGSADDRLYGGAGSDNLDGDNAAPAFGYGPADFCDGGSGPDTFVNCELR